MGKYNARQTPMADQSGLRYCERRQDKNMYLPIQKKEGEWMAKSCACSWFGGEKEGREESDRESEGCN